jgi:hypothetical protein
MKYDLELYEYGKVLSIKQMIQHGIDLPDDPQAQAIKQALESKNQDVDEAARALLRGKNWES